MSVSEAAPATHETNIVTETEPVVDEQVVDEQVVDEQVVDEQVVDETTKRVRTHTEKGRDLYHAKCIEHKKSCDASWDKVETLLMKLPTCEQTMPALSELETNINKAFTSYSQVSEKYVQYLERVNSDESRVEKDRHTSYYNRTKVIVDRKLSEIKNFKLDVVENVSLASSHSSTSTLARKRAKAEAQRVRLQFMQKEAELVKKKVQMEEQEATSRAAAKRQKAELEVDIGLLKQETEAAVANTEAEALEFQERGLPLDDLPNEPVDRTEMTRDYVDNLTVSEPEDNVALPRDDLFRTPSPARPCAQPTPRIVPSMPRTIPNQPAHPSVPIQTYANDQPVQPALVSSLTQRTNPSVQTFVNNQPVQPAVVSDLTQFLLRKDLLLTRFTNFDDLPESFASWKATFKSITTELKVSVFEEMDLLVKWLGPSSSKFARSIRAANVGDADKGLGCIWERLQERYGRPEMVESALKKKLNAFPHFTNKDSGKLYDLLDILTEIESAKANPQYSTLLAYFDSSSGINPIVQKLPYGLQEKWTNQASKYKKTNTVSYPPFSFFVNFIKDMSAIRNDPAFMYQRDNVTPGIRRDADGRKGPILVRKTDVSDEDSLTRCPIHKAGHSLNECRSFKSKTLDERKQFLKEKQICFKCCMSDKHIFKNCRADVKCEHCGSKRHASAMHIEKPKQSPQRTDGGEQPQNVDSVESKCTKICGQNFRGRSCGKTLLVDVYPKGHPEKTLRLYAILDDQSSGTLGTTALFDNLDISDEPTTYTLKSCSGSTTMIGRRAKDLVIQCIDSSEAFELPVVIECDDIPNETSEIATPEVAMSHPHLQSIAPSIPPLDTRASIQLLIGRDLPEVHHVKDQIVGPRGAPFAQKLALGWAIVGEVCLGQVHSPHTLNVNKTHVMSNGRGTVFEPCKYNIHVKEHLNPAISVQPPHDFKGDNVFMKSADDDQVSLSVEDRKFLDLMNKELYRDENGHWTAPLPFRSPLVVMPNNRSQAWKRAQVLDASLCKDPVKEKHFLTFMKKVLDSGAAEVAPSTPTNDCWYLPLFGVYHPHKPDQIRGVFDSSAVFEGVSLNNVLMTGPDLTNSLLGILLRFRKDRISIMADVEQMFYQFYVKEEHRDYLRFFWHKDNKLDCPLIEYRMKVHVFGNSPSPSIATYGLRRTVTDADEDVKTFVSNDFYVDDALTSLPTSTEAVNLIRKTQATLKEKGSIRLHKIASNSAEVMTAFPVDDLEKNIKFLTLGEDALPLQRSLGMSWDLNEDCFLFSVVADDKPYTRRGILSTVNSLYDPLGFIAPITIGGKILLRDVAPPGTDWDEPLSESHQRKWKDWLTSLQALQHIRIPRMCVPQSISLANTYEVHIFCDASEVAIASVAYIKVVDSSGASHLGFLMGKSKLAPSKGHTIPRLELCGAVLATEIADILSRHLSIDLNSVCYHTDSRVVLGYIGNLTRRFYTYVSNRVERIHKISTPSQWSFVPTHVNPADSGTRPSTSVIDLSQSSWINGPKWLQEQPTHQEHEKAPFPLIDPDTDKELRPEIVAQKTSIEIPAKLGTHRYERFSAWHSAVTATSFLRHVIHSFKAGSDKCRGWHTCTNRTLQEYQDAETFLLKEVQRESFAEEIYCLSNGKHLPKNSPILSLCPILDNEGLLRVGGRISRLKEYLPTSEINPVILPKGHHISELLIRHHHEAVRHQGRHLTEGAIRSAGLWIVGVKRMVASLIHNCVVCRKLRRSTECQKMADLPQDRITPGPPFTSVGVDAFGPWQVVFRRTRGGVAHNKRWGILFTCLTTRAVHLEVVEEMSSSSFINALRRFTSLRGPVKLFRSDRGTNFVGATDDLKIDAVNVEDGSIRKFLHHSGISWIFNAPHASHMGGVWERMIGLTRRILDSLLLDQKSKPLTQEMLVTLMAEVSAIINSRPIAQISTDPDSPMILRPSMLLTGKVDLAPAEAESLDLRDIYRADWKRVRYLADTFWQLWRKSYLQELQTRRKWQVDRSNLKVGDVVLMKDQSVHRNEWPMGIIRETFPSEDGKVRKIAVGIYKDGKSTTYVRPINEVVLLLE